MSVILRVISRRLVLRQLGADDWWMLVGIVSLPISKFLDAQLLTLAIGKIATFGYLFEILYGLRFGIGLHTKDDSVPNMIELLKV